MPVKPRKIPMRMCVGCREMKPKRELIRVVRSQDGNVTVDFTGKAAGRGAYVCRSVECLERAIKTRGLDRALEHKIEDTVFLQLKEELQAGDR